MQVPDPRFDDHARLDVAKQGADLAGRPGYDFHQLCLAHSHVRSMRGSDERALKPGKVPPL